MAHMELRYDKVRLCRLANVVPTEKYSSEPEVYEVHVREKEKTVPHGENPIEWTLYTSHPVSVLQKSLQVIRYCKSPWVIEDLFCIVKSEGVDYEFGELESGIDLQKLFVMAFMAAIQILQLRQARTGEADQNTLPVF